MKGKEALFVNNRGMKGNMYQRQVGGKEKMIECFNCKRKGHKKSQCWAKGGGQEGKGP